MNLLIVNVNVDPEQTKRFLEEKFPELTIHAAAGEGDVGDFIEAVSYTHLTLPTTPYV